MLSRAFSHALHNETIRTNPIYLVQLESFLGPSSNLRRLKKNLHLLELWSPKKCMVSLDSVLVRTVRNDAQHLLHLFA